MSDNMNAAKQFEKHCANFYEGMINTLASFLSVHANLVSLNGKNPGEIGIILHHAAGVPQLAKAPAAPLPVAAAFGGPGMPAGGIAGLAMGAPACGGAKKSSGAKGACLWKTVPEYQQMAQSARICAYMTNRGSDLIKNKVCCAPAVNGETEPNSLEWRCATCHGKAGVIKKHIGETGRGAVAAPTAPVPGYNMPNPGSFPQMGGAAPPAFPQAGFPQTSAPAFPTAAAPPAFPQMGGAAPPAFPTAAPAFPTAAAPPAFPQTSAPAFPTAAPAFPTSAAPPAFPQMGGAPAFPIAAAPPAFPQAPVSAVSTPSSAPAFPQTTAPPAFPVTAPVTAAPIPAFTSTPQQVSLVSAMPPLPTPAQLQAQSEVQIAKGDDDEVDVFENDNLKDIAFPSDAAHCNLVLREVDGKLQCLGKLQLESGPVTKTSAIPGTWFTTQYLVEVSDEDKAYLQKNNIEYVYSGQPVASTV